VLQSTANSSLPFSKDTCFLMHVIPCQTASRETKDTPVLALCSLHTVSGGKGKGRTENKEMTAQTSHLKQEGGMMLLKAFTILTHCL